MEKNNPESVKLWARVGVTVNVSPEVYGQLQDEKTNNVLMLSILKGQVGEVYLDGETYFPDIEENGKLSEVSFDLYAPEGRMGFIDSHRDRSFYYTFGTSQQFPYQKGWVEVQAANRQEADKFFRLRFPDRNEGVLNCASVYDEAQFIQTRPLLSSVSGWNVCHEIISRNSLARQGLDVSGHLQKNNDAATNLIAAMREYASASAWTDGEFIDALVQLGVTQEDFRRAGMGDFAKDYFEGAGKPSLSDKIQSASQRASSTLASSDSKSRDPNVPPQTR